MSRSEYIEYFVQLMNDFAAEAGALDTHFENPDGYDDADHYTTASDMIKLTKKALEYPLIREICAMTNVSRTIASGQQVSWSSSNRLLFSSGEYYYQYATGLKTLDPCGGQLFGSHRAERGRGIHSRYNGLRVRRGQVYRGKEAVCVRLGGVVYG